MTAFPNPATGSCTIPLDRGLVHKLVVGLVALYLGEPWAKTVVNSTAKAAKAAALNAYTEALDRLGFPTMGNRFAILNAVQDVLAITPLLPAGPSRREWLVEVHDKVTDRLLGITTCDYPDGLAEEDWPQPVWDARSRMRQALLDRFHEAVGNGTW